MRLRLVILYEIEKAPLHPQNQPQIHATNPEAFVSGRSNHHLCNNSLSDEEVFQTDILH